ncbi:hypothetical protein F5051DRAFT_464736 [Lentinula edodes]|nr:hypothetical protein F5051DRAFT_464736 [Lentinula edodes]
MKMRMMMSGDVTSRNEVMDKPSSSSTFSAFPSFSSSPSAPASTTTTNPTNPNTHGTHGITTNPITSTTTTSTTTTSTHGTTSIHGRSTGPTQKNPTIPQEPSKLRFSCKPDSEAGVPPSTVTSVTPPLAEGGLGGLGVSGDPRGGAGAWSESKSVALLPSGFGTKLAPAHASSHVSVPTSALISIASDPKHLMQSLPVTDLLVFSFDLDFRVDLGVNIDKSKGEGGLLAKIGGGSGNPSAKAKQTANQTPLSDLPCFDFDSVMVLVASTSTSTSTSLLLLLLLRRVVGCPNHLLLSLSLLQTPQNPVRPGSE